MGAAVVGAAALVGAGEEEMAGIVGRAASDLGFFAFGGIMRCVPGVFSRTANERESMYTL